ncbi:hypothetical protein A1Q2_08507 [Trichosporon asahii var. asahii CBS 8904]|uniref:Uncharacterized protein n=1 Tax=Trichosporon asahii var. asahii (strain CBS 8904) TaxID=1220162 RepID=K1V960_TRIAC|nr:hypothetical protein A1Q2_08507 [Trichosporon asahii var. asahii CBS 8904]
MGFFGGKPTVTETVQVSVDWSANVTTTTTITKTDRHGKSESSSSSRTEKDPWVGTGARIVSDGSGLERFALPSVLYEILRSRMLEGVVRAAIGPYTEDGITVQVSPDVKVQFSGPRGRLILPGVLIGVVGWMRAMTWGYAQAVPMGGRQMPRADAAYTRAIQQKGEQMDIADLAAGSLLLVTPGPDLDEFPWSVAAAGMRCLNIPGACLVKDVRGGPVEGQVVCMLDPVQAGLRIPAPTLAHFDMHFDEIFSPFGESDFRTLEPFAQRMGCVFTHIQPRVPGGHAWTLTDNEGLKFTYEASPDWSRFSHTLTRGAQPVGPPPAYGDEKGGGAGPSGPPQYHQGDYKGPSGDYKGSSNYYASEKKM